MNKHEMWMRMLYLESVVNDQTPAIQREMAKEYETLVRRYYYSIGD